MTNLRAFWYSRQAPRSTHLMKAIFARICLVRSSPSNGKYFPARGFTAPGFRATITLYNTRNAAYGVVRFVFSGQALKTRCRRLNNFLSHSLCLFEKQGIIHFLFILYQERCPIITNAEIRALIHLFIEEVRQLRER